MEIRKSTMDDLKEIIKLYEKAREFMKANGNPNQWSSNYPEVTIIKGDIKKGISYVCTHENEIVGTFMYAQGPDKTYQTIYDGKWLNDEPYEVIHRITSSGKIKGIATFCLTWCSNQSKNVRIDTHKDNLPMQNLLNKNGFVRCGIIYLENGEERIAYQKKIA